MTDPALPGVITDPHTSFVVASYVVAAVGMVALTLLVWWDARRWARRAALAAKAEAETKGK